MSDDRPDLTPERLAEIAARSQAMAEGAARHRAAQAVWTEIEVARLAKLGIHPKVNP